MSHTSHAYFPSTLILLYIIRYNINSRNLHCSESIHLATCDYNEQQM